jgi:hypothetical protein
MSFTPGENCWAVVVMFNLATLLLVCVMLAVSALGALFGNSIYWLIFSVVACILLCLYIKMQGSKVGKAVKGAGVILCCFGAGWIIALIVVRFDSSIRRDLVDPPQAFAFGCTFIGIPSIACGLALIYQSRKERLL